MPAESVRCPFPMTFDAIKALVRDDLDAVDRDIRARLQSEVALIDQLAGYLIAGGGKRLRPLIVLLAAKALGYAGRAHIALATIIEFIHTATLLHDDVVDASEMRRGRTTANAVWGNEAAVLVGDFMYSRAFELMVELNDMRIMAILAHTTNTIAKGEVLQLLNCHDPETTEDRYLAVVQAKTAKLFEASSRLAAVVNGSSDIIETALARYGAHLGMAFQLVDDVLDYGRDNPALGKNVGDDLSEGNPTLPLIHALRHGTANQQALIRSAIENGGGGEIEAVVDAIESAGSIAYTAGRAQVEAERARQALDPLPDSPHKQALIELAYFSIRRDH